MIRFFRRACSAEVFSTITLFSSVDMLGTYQCIIVVDGDSATNRFLCRFRHRRRNSTDYRQQAGTTRIARRWLVLTVRAVRLVAFLAIRAVAVGFTGGTIFARILMHLAVTQFLGSSSGVDGFVGHLALLIICCAVIAGTHSSSRPDNITSKLFPRFDDLSLC